MKMPELSEHVESDAKEKTTLSAAPPAASGETVSADFDTSESPFTSQDGDLFPVMNSGNVLTPPIPSDDPVTPSIPDSFLKQLGLSTGDVDMNDSRYVHQLKFVAFVGMLRLDSNRFSRLLAVVYSRDIKQKDSHPL